MVKGLFTAYTGMYNEQKRMDIITNNLANTNTTGFKREGVTAEAFRDLLALRMKDDESPGLNPHRLGLQNMGVKIGEVYTDWQQGPLRQTDNPYDVAIAGEGFFTISYTNKSGETSTKYTRDGNFELTQDGYLVTMDGDFVLSSTGQRIKLDPALDSKIDRTGRIWQDGREVARLGIANFANYDYLEKYAETLYTPLEGAQITTSDAETIQGYLETSNVETVTEMVNMIAITRNYETNQKVIKTMDESLRIAANQLGKA
jgi:flagellar basal-body rod protein FlgG